MWEFWDSHLRVGLMAKHIVYYKGESGGFPQVCAVVSLVNPNLYVASLVENGHFATGPSD